MRQKDLNVVKSGFVLPPRKGADLGRSTLAQYAEGRGGYERDPESLEETPLMPHMTATESQLR